jgi:signal transduction histidine kinase
MPVLPVISTVVAMLAAVPWSRQPTVLTGTTVAAAVVSLVDTALLRGTDATVPYWLLAETAAFMVVQARVVRGLPVRQAVLAATAVVLAVVTAPLRIALWLDPPAPAWQSAVVCFCWLLLITVATAVGAHLRGLDQARVRAVADARREQRVQLARDVHDWLAHEMTGIVLEAQAGRLRPDRPDDMAAALDRIESAGQRGLAAMDRSLRLLRDADEPVTGERLPGLVEITEVAQRFTATGTATAEVRIDPAAAPGPAVAATAHRVVLESLTNVRRHATGVSVVSVDIRHTGDDLRVTVTDDGTGAGTARRVRAARGGTGLAGLTERVEALGGTLAAGPANPAGWQVSAVLPVTP